MSSVVVILLFRKSGSGSGFDAGNVDWSNWGSEWAEPGSENINGQQVKSLSGSWNDWNDEELSPVTDRNHSAAKKQPSHGWNPATAKKQEPAREELNLINFDTASDDISGKKAPGRLPSNEGWDAEVWADVDDDNWEAIEDASTSKKK